MTNTVAAAAHTLTNDELRDELNRMREAYREAVDWDDRAPLLSRLTELSVTARARDCA